MCSTFGIPMRRGKAVIHSCLTAEDAKDAEKNAEKTSEAIDPSSPIRSLFPSVFVSAPSASSAVRIFALLPTGIGYWN
jgi:hypothetical protein